MMIKIKHDNAYKNVCMIKINVITFLNWSNHQIENAIRKRENEQEKRWRTVDDFISKLKI